MRDHVVQYWFSYAVIIGVLLMLPSCSKTEDVEIQSDSQKRLIEVLTLENGINYSRDEYSYQNGKLCVHYSYEWSENGNWEKKTRSICKCWPNNFLATAYSGSDLSWTPESELWVKFQTNKPIEIIQNGYRSNISQMQAMQKWKFTYHADLLTLSELQTYRDQDWHSYYKTENTYKGERITEMRSYCFHDDKWSLTAYSDFIYDFDQLKQIRSFNRQEDKWILQKTYEFHYTGSLLSECSCYKHGKQGEPSYIECKRQYTYDEGQNLIYESCSNKENVIEKYYSYQDSCGNYSCTLGKIHAALQFPLQLPEPH
jgi:hypothetical protein